MEANLPARPLIGLLLRLVYQHYAQDIDAALREAGFDDIRPAAANVFPFVTPEGITVSELAELAQVRKQTMAQAVDQLERTGYVERRPNPNDRRSRLVCLTDRGKSVPPVTHAAAERSCSASSSARIFARCLSALSRRFEVVTLPVGPTTSQERRGYQSNDVLSSSV